MAKLIAAELGGDVDVVLVRKLRAPGNPEFAVGAIEESGWAFIAAHAHDAGADDAYLEREKQAQMETIRRRRIEYTAHRAAHRPGRTHRDRRRRRPRHRLHHDRRAARAASARTRRSWSVRFRSRPPTRSSGWRRMPTRSLCLETPFDFSRGRAVLPRVPPGRGRGGHRVPRSCYSARAARSTSDRGHRPRSVEQAPAGRPSTSGPLARADPTLTDS